MEASSPLAAIHRPAVQSFGRPDIFRSRGSNPFNGEPRSSGTLFRDRIMAKGKPDYFSDKGVHSSSPSGSLSADLSQNFCIDNEASPQLTTPRRALFTTSITKDALEGRDFQTNSPLPATSSPAAPNVDASPVRLQKTPFVKEVVIASPTPLADAERDEVLLLLESPVPSGRRSSGDGLKRLVDRRKQNLRRPSLARTKGYSTSSITSRWYSASSTSGSKSNKDELPRSPSLNLSLGDCFQDSPPQERRSISFNSPSSGNSGSVRVNRTLFTSLSNASKRSASPLAASPSRRTSNPIRPRKQYRRSLSMFEKSVDVIQPKESAKLQAVVDIEEPAELLLPHFFPEGQNDSIPRLSKATFLDILDGKHNEHYDNKLIIDCRFEYEFAGGHVSGAVNYNDKEALAAKLFPNSPELTGRTLLVFHCEYSAHRAPLMARHIRSEDRAINVENYPRLTYPEVYILDGGYSSFFTENRERCEPQAYVEMDAAEHAKTCEEELDRLRKPRKGLSRAKTYAFGQKSSVVGCDSPTAACKYSLDDSPLQTSESPSLFIDKSHTKRMASY